MVGSVNMHGLISNGCGSILGALRQSGLGGSRSAQNMVLMTTWRSNIVLRAA